MRRTAVGLLDGCHFKTWRMCRGSDTNPVFFQLFTLISDFETHWRLMRILAKNGHCDNFPFRPQVRQINTVLARTIWEKWAFLSVCVWRVCVQRMQLQKALLQNRIDFYFGSYRAWKTLKWIESMIICYNANQRMQEKTDGALITFAGSGMGWGVNFERKYRINVFIFFMNTSKLLCKLVYIVWKYFKHFWSISSLIWLFSRVFQDLNFKKSSTKVKHFKHLLRTRYKQYYIVFTVINLLNVEQRNMTFRLYHLKADTFTVFLFDWHISLYPVYCY